MIYYIDFDSTLFNTTLFYHDLLEIFNKNSLTKEMVIEYKISHNDKLYDPIKMANYYVEKGLVNNNIVIEIDDLFNKITNYLYDDAIKFLENNKDKKLVLLTYGEYHYQKLKIDKCNITKYFSDIIITEHKKHHLDLDYQNGVFVDDNPIVINGLLKMNPNKIIRIKRVNNKYSKIPLISKKVINYPNLESVIL